MTTTAPVDADLNREQIDQNEAINDKQPRQQQVVVENSPVESVKTLDGQAEGATNVGRNEDASVPSTKKRVAQDKVDGLENFTPSVPPPTTIPSSGLGSNLSHQDSPGRRLSLSGPNTGATKSTTKRPLSDAPLSNLKLDPDKRRKSSAVSFKDVCELFEVDLEANNFQRPAKPAAVFSLRYYVMILALVSPFIVTYSKTIINFAIIDMIDTDFLNAQSHSHGHTQSTPAIGLSDVLPTNSDADDIGGQATGQDSSYYDTDNSCPVDEVTRARLNEDLTTDTKRAREHAGEKFQWNTVQQGLLKAAYSIGHMLMQVAGGRLSEIYGTHLITGVSSLLIGLACLLAPFLASADFYLLFADLFILGTLGSFMTPALITLFTNWLTPSEKSMMMSLYLVSSRLGYALSAVLCGLLISAHLSWRYLFYSAGWISFVFAVVFSICARSRPFEHPLMGQEELDYLASKNTLVREALLKKATEGAGDSSNQAHVKGGPKDSIQMSTMNGDETKKQEAAAGSQSAPVARAKQASGAPWLAIMTNLPVWAFITTKFCVKLAGDTVQIELPTYLNRVMHLTARHNGFVNGSNYVIFCISCVVVGMLAKSANKKRPFGWSKTIVRKVFQVTASFGASLALLGISLCVCQETMTLALLMLMFFFTTFSTGGEAQIPLDISERYAGTIHAIGSSLAISGIIEPILVGFILKDYPADRDRWAAVWLGASAISFLGGLVFMLFGDATLQPFDNIDQKTSGDVTPSGAKYYGDDQASMPRSSQGSVAAKLTELKGHDNETFEDDGERGDSQSNKAEVPYKESGQI